LPSGTPATYEFRIIRKDGIVRWLQSRAQAITDAAGHLVRLYGAARDITERKEQETELRQSQRFIQQVADTMPAILLVYDLGEERLVYVNRQIVALLGYTPEEIRNRPGAELRELVHPDDLRRLTARAAHIMQSGQGEPSPLEYRVQHANGEWRWLRSRETVFRRAGTGTPEQVLGIAQDITTEKRLASLLNEHTKTIDLKAVGRRLLQLRESLGMTQPDFGAYLGVFTQTQISNYERGAAVIPIELLVALRERGHPLEIILGTGMPPLVDETLKYLPASQPRRVLVEHLAEALVRLLKRDRQITEGILRTMELPARELSPEQQHFFAKLTEGET
jgi:PAS domain S-box-containing protein